MKRCDDYLQTQRKAIPPVIRQKVNGKNEILNSNGTDQNKPFGSKPKNKTVEIRIKPFFVF